MPINEASKYFLTCIDSQAEYEARNKQEQTAKESQPKLVEPANEEVQFATAQRKERSTSHKRGSPKNQTNELPGNFTF